MNMKQHSFLLLGFFGVCDFSPSVFMDECFNNLIPLNTIETLRMVGDGRKCKAETTCRLLSCEEPPKTA